MIKIIVENCCNFFFLILIIVKNFTIIYNIAECNTKKSHKNYIYNLKKLRILMILMLYLDIVKNF